MSHCFQTTTRKSVTTRDTRGPPISEPYLLCGIAHEKLAAQVINIKRSYVGEYRTPLDMAGASPTLVKPADEIEQLLAAPAEIAYRIF